jgi:hypothetical protein
MNTEREIINKVAQSPIITIDLEELYEPGERVLYDIKDNLYEGIILKEKDFRQFLKSNNWSVYQDKHVALYCSVDAIIPRWAYMLLAVQLTPYAKTIVFGDLVRLEDELFKRAILLINPRDYREKKVVIKGCSKIQVPTSAYVEITKLLKPYAFSIMYGEPCSTVPLYKKPKNIKN